MGLCVEGRGFRLDAHFGLGASLGGAGLRHTQLERKGPMFRASLEGLQFVQALTCQIGRLAICTGTRFERAWRACNLSAARPFGASAFGALGSRICDALSGNFLGVNNGTVGSK